MQTISIEIEDRGEFARCHVPLYGDMYGRSVEEMMHTLDMMSKAGAFCDLMKIEVQNAI